MLLQNRQLALLAAQQPEAEPRTKWLYANFVFLNALSEKAAKPYPDRVSTIFKEIKRAQAQAGAEFAKKKGRGLCPDEFAQQINE